MTFLKSRSVGLVLRLFVGGLFLYASLDKIAHPNQFAISVRAYQLIPVSVSTLFALLVCWSEAVSGALLILGVFTRKAAGAIFILLGMFVVALSIVLIKGMVIDCGCFKSGEHASSAVSPLLILRNVVLLACCFVIIQYNDGFLSLWPGRRKNATT